MNRRNALLFIGATLASNVEAQPVTYRVRLLSPLSTRRNRDGDTITARVVAPASLQGTVMEGVVQKSKSSKNLKVMSTKSELLFGFYVLHLKNKKNLEIDTKVISFKNSKGKRNVDEEGQIIEQTNGAKRMAILGGAGAAIGGVLKRGKGAAVGAAAGVILTTFTCKAPDIDFETGSEFELTVQTRAAS